MPRDVDEEAVERCYDIVADGICGAWEQLFGENLGRMQEMQAFVLDVSGP